MKNMINKMMFLMALGCVEQTSCDWLSTWNAFKDDAGSKWHEFKGKVEDKWHNFENKSNNETIIQKFDAKAMKDFLNDPEQKEFEFKSSTGKKVELVKVNVILGHNKGRFDVFCDGEKLVDFYNYLEYPLKNEFSNRRLINELLTKGALSPREVFAFLISLGVNVTDDFDRFLHSINDVAKAPGDNKFCVFKNTDGEFITFYINENYYGYYEFHFGPTSENDKNYRKTDNGSGGPVYSCFDINQTEKLEKYFTEEQLTKMRNTLKDWQDSLNFRNIEVRNAKRLHGIS